MQRGANNDDTRGMELEDRVQDEMMSDLPMDSSFRGLSDHEFNLAAMSQVRSRSCPSQAPGSSATSQARGTHLVRTRQKKPNDRRCHRPLKTPPSDLRPSWPWMRSRQGWSPCNA
eukprot:scaffold544_cov256-Pinguiococcus_pyrenoidosus.AAC.15